MAPKRILLATDLTARCDRALDRAAALAAEWKAQLVVVHAVQEPAPITDEPSWRQPVDPRELALAQVRADLLEAPLLDLEIVVERADPVALVVETTARLGCELVITGIAHDKTLGRTLLGTTVETLARKSLVPVLVVKVRPHGAYRSVLVTTDFSETSRVALETALALWPEASVRLFHGYQVAYEGIVGETVEARENAERHARAEAETFLNATPVAAARAIPVICEYGRPAALITELVQARGVDLVVVGSRGRGWLATTLLGSVAQTLVDEVPGDVLIVRHAE